MTKPATGRRVEIEVNGHVVPCATIGALAAAVGRTSRTIREWERAGLIPLAPFVLGGTQNARRRLYPMSLIADIQRTVADQQFGRRRPSGRFLAQQERLFSAWDVALEPLRKKDEWVTNTPEPGAGRQE